MKNKHAAALGRLNQGRKKTMTKAAIEQRRQAVKARWKKYRESKVENKLDSGKRNSGNGSV